MEVRSFLVLAILGAGPTLAGCAAPVALTAIDPVDFPTVLSFLPEGSEEVELPLDDGTVLRGAYVPPAPGGPIVLHLQGSGGSIARGNGGRAHVLRELADLGIGSLMLDWSGVGVSSGRRSNAALRSDASAMWREAVRRVGGDEARVILRATSLGTLAAASLVEEGAKPAAMVWIEPVRAQTAVGNFVRHRFGSFLGAIVAATTRPIVDVDLGTALSAAPCPLLLLQPQDPDIFVTEKEEEGLRRASSAEGTRIGSVPGGHIEVAVHARSLLTQERAFLQPWIPALPDARARAEALRTRIPIDAAATGSLLPQEVRDRLSAIVPLTRTQPDERILGAALASRSPWNGVRLLWLLQGADGALPADYQDLGPTDLVEALSLADPAGELPLEEVAHIRRHMREVLALGGVVFRIRLDSVAPMVWSGAIGASWYWTASAAVPWIGSVKYRFDHDAVWRALLERGLDPADARRQMARVLLLAYGFAQRLHWSAAGRPEVQVRRDGAWETLDLETLPTTHRSGMAFSVLVAPPGSGPPP